MNNLFKGNTLFESIKRDLFFFKKKYIQAFAKFAKMIFSKQYYSDMKDYFHPNLHRFIERYTYPEDNLYFAATISHGQKQSIDYKNGKQCIDPIWRQMKIKT